MEAHLEALLKLSFYTRHPNFGVEAHMESVAGVALRLSALVELHSTSKRNIPA
jgi:hypothetical protein